MDGPVTGLLILTMISAPFAVGGAVAELLKRRFASNFRAGRQPGKSEVAVFEKLCKQVFCSLFLLMFVVVVTLEVSAACHEGLRRLFFSGGLSMRAPMVWPMVLGIGTDFFILIIGLWASQELGGSLGRYIDGQLGQGKVR